MLNYCLQQVWFQNRRARFFKSKKPSREVTKPPTDTIYPSTPSPPFYNLDPSFPVTPSLPSPGYPTPSSPQSTRLSTELGSQGMSLSVPRSPISADQATSCPQYGLRLPGVPQDCYDQTPDFTDFCFDMLAQSGLSDWDLTDEFEAFLGHANGSEPVGSRCAAVTHHGAKESVQTNLDQHFPITDVSMDDLSELWLQELDDFNLSDLNVSAAMIDYLLSWLKQNNRSPLI